MQDHIGAEKVQPQRSPLSESIRFAGGQLHLNVRHATITPSQGRLLAFAATVGYGRFRMMVSTVLVASMCWASSADMYRA